MNLTEMYVAWSLDQVKNEEDPLTVDGMCLDFGEYVMKHVAELSYWKGVNRGRWLSENGDTPSDKEHEEIIIALNQGKIEDE